MDQKNIASETAIVGQNCGIVGPIQECLGCSSASTLDPASCGCTWGGSRWMVVWFPGSSCPYNDGAPGSGSAAIWEVNSSMEDPSVSLCHSSQINKTSAATERRRPFAKRGRQQSFLGEKIRRASRSLLALLDPSALFYSLNPVPGCHQTKWLLTRFFHSSLESRQLVVHPSTSALTSVLVMQVSPLTSHPMPQPPNPPGEPYLFAT